MSHHSAAHLRLTLSLICFWLAEDGSADMSGSGSGAEADMYFGVRVPIHVKTLLETSQRSAKVLVHDHKQKLGWTEPWPGGDEGRRVSE